MSIQALVLFPADGLGAGTLVMVVHLMPPTLLVRGIRPVLAATPAHPALPAPATSLTDRAPAASLSNCGCQRGPVPGRPHRRAQQAQASPGHHRDRVFIPIGLLGWWLAIGHPIRLARDRSARLHLAVLKPEGKTVRSDTGTGLQAVD